jgi:hypothetical protein
VSDPRADRLRRFRLHAFVFTAALMVAIAVNAIASPAYPWWMWLASVWALPLALHWAYAREMIGGRR